MGPAATLKSVAVHRKTEARLNRCASTIAGKGRRLRCQAPMKGAAAARPGGWLLVTAAAERPMVRFKADSAADLKLLPALSRVLRRNVKSKAIPEARAASRYERRNRDTKWASRRG